MSTVGYIVRDMTGTNQHGNFVEGTPSILDTTYTKDVSLNLSPSDVESYARRGSDLHITLANGETLVLDSYFNTGATGAKNLFLSEEGDFIEVVLEDRAQGMLFASYEPLDLTGKWSAYDDMVFLDIDRIEPVVAPLIAAPLFGGLGAGAAGAAVVGGAAVLGGGGGGGGGADTTAPTVNVTSGTQSTGDIVNATAHTNNPVISGTGEAGATVSVEIEGTTQTTTVAGDGTWSVAFDSSAISTGEHTKTITIVTTDASGNSTTSTDTLVVDTVAPVINFNTVEGDNVINAVEASNGVTLTGTGEAGASIVVTFQGQQQTTTVAGDGSWSVNYAASSIAAGTYSSDFSVVSTDAAGNSTTSTHTVTVDTETTASVNGPIAGDNVINGTEQSAGVTLTGTAEAGSTVVVTLGAASHTVTANASGNWSSVFHSFEIPTGIASLQAQAVSTDLAGNTTTTASTTVAVDTSTYASISSNSAGVDNTVNQSESQAGVTFTGTSEANATITVSVGGILRTTTADASGNWSALYESGSLTGEYGTTVTVTAQDAAGNQFTSTAIPLAIDTLVNEPVIELVNDNAAHTYYDISTAGGTDTYTANTLETNGTVGGSISGTPFAGGTMTNFAFGTPVSDGTHLVVTAADTAGNSSSTLLLHDQGGTEAGATNHVGLSQFNIDAIELGFSDNVDLTLNEADIKALSNNSDTVTIHGGTDDKVNILGAVDTNTNQTIDGDLYNVYTIGTDGTTLIIEDDIVVSVI